MTSTSFVRPLVVATALTLGGAAAGFSQQLGTPSRLVDTSMWNLRSPNLVRRFQEMRESITADPDEAKQRWRRMLRARGEAPPDLRAGGESSPNQGTGRPGGSGTRRRSGRPPRSPVDTGGPDFQGSTPFGGSGDAPSGSATLGSTQLPGLTPETSLLEPVLVAAVGRNQPRVAGDSFLGAIRRQTGDGSPSWLRRRPPGLGGEPGPGAGEGERAEFSVLNETRWEAAKNVLLALGTAYVQQDIQSFMRAFSPGGGLDLTVLRNAVQEDFEQEADAHLDFELMEYRSTFDTFLVRLRWIRSAVLEGGAPTRVNTGESTILLDRGDGFRIKTWIGLPPFGARDPELIKQTKAGSPNDQDNDNTNDDGFGKPDPTPTTTPPTTPPGTPSDAVNLGNQSTSGQPFCIDVDAGPAQIVPLIECGMGDGDLVVDGTSGLSVLASGAGTMIVNCNSTAVLEDFGQVVTPTSTAESLMTGRNSIGVSLGGGDAYALVEFDYDQVNNMVGIRVRNSNLPTFSSAVGLSCP